MRWFTMGYCACYTRHYLVTRSFTPFVNGAGLPEVRFHDLRHTYTTTLTPCDLLRQHPPEDSALEYVDEARERVSVRFPGLPPFYPGGSEVKVAR
jgi:hypothetical protein